jgi:predicted nucleotidyltransferase
MVDMGSIQAVADRIVREYDPDRIILFGSYAYGLASPSSDVDILVVMSFEGGNFRQSMDILNRVDPPFATDILARKPDDTQRRYELGDPLIREALDRGKVLYERSR